MVAFNRQEIKEKGKAEFKNQYWPLVGYSVLASIIASAASSVCGLGAIPVLGQILSIAAAICGVGPFSVALNWMYYRAYKGEQIDIKDMFVTFTNKDLWVKALITSLLVGVYTCLWSMLFIVPGIIKGYSYSMAIFLIMDDPTLTPQEAIKKSQEMTNGYKGDMFVFDLSYIGWFLLGSLTFGILYIFWVVPYYSVAKTGIYARLMENVAPNVVEATYTEVPAPEVVETKETTENTEA